MIGSVRPALLAVLLAGCSPGADSLGIGAECGSEPCPNDLECVAVAAGTYCVKPGCRSDRDCPSESACMIHGEHGDCVRSCDVNLCIRTCILYHERPEECSDECPSFAECNVHRSSDSPAFCVSASESADGLEKKICIPVE